MYFQNTMKISNYDVLFVFLPGKPMVRENFYIRAEIAPLNQGKTSEKLIYGIFTLKTDVLFIF